MILLLTGMLLLTLIGGMTRKKDDTQPQPQPVDVVDDVMPDSFKGTMNDPYDVPAEVKDVIVSYMDAYYRSLYTLEKQDLSSLFENEYIAAVSEKAIDLLIETRKLYQVKIDDPLVVEKRIATLMGNDASKRREWIEANIIFNEEDKFIKEVGGKK